MTARSRPQAGIYLVPQVVPAAAVAYLDLAAAYARAVRSAVVEMIAAAVAAAVAGGGGGAENQRIDGTAREKAPASAGGKDLQRAMDARFGRSREGSEQVVVHEFEGHAQRDDRKGGRKEKGRRRQVTNLLESPCSRPPRSKSRSLRTRCCCYCYCWWWTRTCCRGKVKESTEDQRGGTVCKQAFASHGAAPQPDHHPLLDALTR